MYNSSRGVLGYAIQVKTEFKTQNSSKQWLCSSSRVFKFLCIGKCARLLVYVCTTCPWCPQNRRESRIPTLTGIRGSCEPPSACVCAGDRTQVLCRGSTCSYLPSHLCSLLCSLFSLLLFVFLRLGLPVYTWVGLNFRVPYFSFSTTAGLIHLVQLPECCASFRAAFPYHACPSA